MRRFRPVVTLFWLLGVAAGSAVADAQTFPDEPPYVATEMALVDAMLRLGAVGPDDLLFDLGSGDGRIVLEAARRFGTRGIGYEHQEPLVLLSRARADSLGVSSRVRFVADDLFRADLSDATVVTLYLGAAFNLRLRPILLSTLAPGARVVSNNFHMGEWRPDSTLAFGSGATRAVLHLWHVPARVDGFWSFAVEGEPIGYSLELEQRFQDIRGRARGSGRAYPIAGGLRGRDIRFTMRTPDGPVRLEGTIRDGRMDGVARLPGGGTRRWLALRFTHPGLAPTPH